MACDSLTCNGILSPRSNQGCSQKSSSNFFPKQFLSQAKSVAIMACADLNTLAFEHQHGMVREALPATFPDCREMGHLSSLPGLLQTTANMQKPLSRQRTANLMSALQIIHVFLAPTPTQLGGSVRLAHCANVLWPNPKLMQMC